MENAGPSDVHIAQVRRLVFGAAALIGVAAVLAGASIYELLEGHLTAWETVAAGAALVAAIAPAEAARRCLKRLFDFEGDFVAKSRRLENVLATFDATLQNMPQGVALYDREQRIVLANNRYAEMYGLASDDVSRGMSMKEILEKRVEKGVYIGADPGGYVDGRVTAMAAPADEHGVERFSDGRIIVKSRKPMPSGGWLSVHEDITERQHAEDRISWLAHHDALTSLANRVVLNETVEATFARARQSKETFAILLLDLDDFKIVNDTMGHPVGDKLLQAVAERLRETAGPRDLVARIGGDEFAIVQQGAFDQKAAAADLARRLMLAICRPFDIERCPVSVRLSIGVALAPLDGDSGETLLRNADLALYQAKAAGRHEVRFFDPQMDVSLRVDRALEADLREALGADQFEVHYQAVVDVVTRAPIGMEALVRWRHPRLGMIPPDRFIRLAEKTGLINALGEHVLERACADATTWPEHVKVAVNLSPAQFKSGDLVDIVRGALARTGLPARRLTLEITESTLLERTEENLRVLDEFKSFGVSIALDDFGTGYSSLSYLKTIAFDVVKIDRSFVVEMETNPRSAHIIAGVVALARHLDYTTVAEGIETQQQLDLVRAAGCTAAQGYLFSRPTRASELQFGPQRDSRAA